MKGFEEFTNDMLEFQVARNRAKEYFAWRKMFYTVYLIALTIAAIYLFINVEVTKGLLFVIIPTRIISFILRFIGFYIVHSEIDKQKNKY